MFSLHDIDEQVEIFKGAADNLEVRADGVHDQVLCASLRGSANGLREAAFCLQRMVENEIEREAREAMKR